MTDDRTGENAGAPVPHFVSREPFDPDDEVLCKRIFSAAKQTDHTLTDGEVRAICRAG